MNHPRGKPQHDSVPLAPFHICVEGGQLAVRPALRRFLLAIEPLALGPEETGTIELVLAEVLNNIIEHAYPPSQPSGPIDIRCAHQPDGLLVEITDHGDPMPEGRMPIGHSAPLNVELGDLPEGGFGWFLIKHLARDVTYRRDGDQNCLKMRLAVGRAP